MESESRIATGMKIAQVEQDVTKVRLKPGFQVSWQRSGI